MKNGFSPARTQTKKAVAVRTLVVVALLTALSVVFGKLLALNLGNSIRLSFENLPVLLAGFLLGPFAGLAVGALADLLGCVLVGFSINPIITLGAATVGMCAGLARLLLQKRPLWLQLLAAVGSAHVLGSMLIKSIGLYVFFGTPMSILFIRIPTYIITGALEYALMGLLLRNRGFLASFAPRK